MPTGLFNKLIYTAKKIAFNLKEKQKMTIDDLVLEHMLFYHDLAGSNLENNKETRIVKADIKEALKRENPGQLSLAIKLSPTFWEEQLKNIILELDENQKQLISKLLLLPGKSVGDFDKKSLALNHEDWRVRANAANILAFLQAIEAVPALAEALVSDTTDSALSFCYIAYALGKLQGGAAKIALENELLNSEAWLRVDTAGALAYFPFSDVADRLSTALMQEQEALDYMSYAITRKIKPAKFFQAGTKQTTMGGCRLIFGIVEAADNTFTSDLVLETESHLCIPYLVQSAQETADPIVVDTALRLCNWFSDFRKNINSKNAAFLTACLLELEEQETILKRITNENALKKNIIEIIENTAGKLSGTRNAELLHALRLAGQLDISQTHAKLMRLINELSDDLSTNELKNVIIALSQLSAHRQESVAVLINFANKIVKVEERRQLDKRKQPVEEEDTRQIKTYWEILKALGNLTSVEAAAFLVQALDDYAPDMRSCALESIIEIHQKDSTVNLPKSIDQILQIGLKDSSPMVQLVALLGIAKLNRAELIKDIIPLIDAQENTVSKQAFNSLADIAKNGHESAVKTVLGEKIKTIKAAHKKKRILDILQKY